MLRFPRPFFRKRTGQWYVQFGKKEFPLGPNKTKATAKYKQLLMEHGLREPGKAVTFHELCDAYWHWLNVNRKPSTVESREGRLKRLKWAFPPARQCESVTPAEISTWAWQPIKGGKSPSPTTVADKINLASSVFNWGIKHGMAHKNPVANIPRPEAKIREMHLTQKQIAHILGCIDNPELWQFCYFMLETGARTQEMFVIEAKHLQRSGPRYDRIVLEREHSKWTNRKKTRVIYLPTTVDGIVRELMRRHPTGSLFRTSSGKPYNKNRLNRQMIRLRAKAGIQGLCATVFRHTYCHNRITQGQNPVILAKLMGHTNTKMIEQRYGHLDGSEYLAGEARKFGVVPELGESESTGA